MNILMVSRNFSNQTSMFSMFGEEPQHTLLGAGNLEEAVKMCQSTRDPAPDMVILDANLDTPLTLKALCQKVRDVHPRANVPVLLLQTSAVPMPLDAVRANGFNGDLDLLDMDSWDQVVKTAWRSHEERALHEVAQDQAPTLSKPRVAPRL